MDFLNQIIVELSVKFPVVVTIFTVIGILRAINKPLFALLNAYVEETPSKKDDEKLMKIQTSDAYGIFCFVLDYLTSIKIKK